MKNIVIGLSLAFVLFIVTSVGCSPQPNPTTSPTPAPQPSPNLEPIEIDFVTFMPGAQIKPQVYLKLIEMINEKAKGELIINYKGGPEVIKANDQPVAVQNNVVQMYAGPAAYYAGIVPEAKDALLHSNISLEKELQLGFHDLLREAHKKAGFYYIGRNETHGENIFYLSTTEPINNVREDLPKLKCSCSGPNLVHFSERIGMGFQVIPNMDQYTALDTGLTNAVMTPIDTAWALGYYEVAKYTIDHPFFPSNGVFLMNLDTWNGFPEHIQNTVMEAYNEYMPVNATAFKNLYEDNRKKALEIGAEFNKLPPNDAEWYIDTIYDAEWDYIESQHPDYGPKYRALLFPE